MPLALLMGLILVAPENSRAEDLKVEARLIWRTNDDKSPDPKHVPVDGATAKRLTNVFKWKRYFVVNTVRTNIASRSTVRLPMSKVCEVEITEQPGEKVEVKLYGEGKKVNKTTDILNKETCITLGGPDKNGTAWFVIVRQL